MPCSRILGLVRGVIAVCLTVASLAWLQAQDLQGPPPNHREVAKIIASIVPKQHLLRQPLDDKVSERALQEFLKMLDPLKAYFDQADIDEFQRQKFSIDDAVVQGDLTFAYTIFNRFLQRVEQRVATVQQLLASDLDFDREESLTIEPDKLSYPRTEQEAVDRWRKRIKYDLLMLESEEKDPAKRIERLERRYVSFLKRMKQTDSDELLEMYLTAITTSIDPHTTYMSPNSLTNFRILMRLNLEGIGAGLQVMDGYTTITKVIAGGAADKQTDLKEEDRIVSVGQDDDGEMVDVVDMKLTDVVKMIRGAKGTVVRLGVIPSGGGETKTYRIIRDRVDLTDSEARSVIMDVGTKPDGQPYRIGVINLPSFYMDMEAARLNLPNYRSTTRDVRRILDGFRSKAVDGVVLDLRRNGGGSLNEAIDLTGLFIDTGPVVQVKGFTGRVDTYRDLDAGVAWSGPLVVLTSKFSASASEILAGAIQDYRRGIVVGDKATHGKGTVQSLMEIGAEMFRIDNPPNLGALKITMQQFYRPHGESTQKRGVLADVPLPSISTHMDVGEEDLDYAVEFDRVPAANFRTVQMTSPEVNKWLVARSQQRMKESEDFAKLNKDIDRYQEQKAQEQISLKRDDFLKRLDELDLRKEEEKQLEEQEKDVVVDRDFYFEEVLDITTDYIRALVRSRNAFSQNAAGAKGSITPQR